MRVQVAHQDRKLIQAEFGCREQIGSDVCHRDAVSEWKTRSMSFEVQSSRSMSSILILLYSHLESSRLKYSPVKAIVQGRTAEVNRLTEMLDEQQRGTQVHFEARASKPESSIMHVTR